MMVLFWAVLMSVLVYMTGWFLFAKKLGDNSVVDVAWGLGFVTIALGLLFVRQTRLQALLLVLVGFWGIRLATHIARRKVGAPEDWRYAQWRKDWGKHIALRSFFQVFMFQGVLMSVIALPLVIAVADTKLRLESSTVLFGVAVWLLGFVIESTADQQLARFVRSRKTADAIMTDGLWKYSRHPNYFGESTQWWGIWLITASSSYVWIGLLSPVLLTVLLLFVSGVPILERKYKHNKEFQEYAAVTSVFIPLPPRKITK